MEINEVELLQMLANQASAVMKYKTRADYLSQAITTMSNAKDNELVGEILNELMRAKVKVEEWEREEAQQ